MATKAPLGGVRSSLKSSSALEPVIVDREICRQVAGLIESQTIPTDREDTSLAGFTAKQVANFYILLVAICHQTSPRDEKPLEGIVGTRHLRGWDYLSNKLQVEAHSNPAILSTSYWEQITKRDVQELFRDDRAGDSLSDPDGRAKLIQDLGHKMRQHKWESANEIYALSEHRIATGAPNLLTLLSQFRAYDDPVRKKSYFLLALMKNAGLWTYSDAYKLGAPVDYHEIRGHLRIGTVRICDPDMRSKLLNEKEVSSEEDISIRLAVHRALVLVSDYSGVRNPSQIHYMFWNIFRSCCTRHDPHCTFCPPTCSLPKRYVSLALFPDGTRRCPFSEVCQSAGRDPKLLEPNVTTDYY
ncbi:MAG: hypothetical protein JO170_16770 [Verrucomicrobia bacterium]|nr:hypothetical protein [Verrucomicrobiota bacterium]